MCLVGVLTPFLLGNHNVSPQIGVPARDAVLPGCKRVACSSEFWPTVPIWLSCFGFLSGCGRKHTTHTSPCSSSTSSPLAIHSERRPETINKGSGTRTRHSRLVEKTECKQECWGPRLVMTTATMKNMWAWHCLLPILIESELRGCWKWSVRSGLRVRHIRGVQRIVRLWVIRKVFTFSPSGKSEKSLLFRFSPTFEGAKFFSHKRVGEGFVQSKWSSVSESVQKWWNWGEKRGTSPCVSKPGSLERGPVGVRMPW